MFEPINLKHPETIESIFNTVINRVNEHVSPEGSPTEKGVLYIGAVRNADKTKKLMLFMEVTTRIVDELNPEEGQE